MNAVLAPASVPYSEIPHVPRVWTWPDVLPTAGVVVFAAAGGTGKGMLMAAATARAVLGLPWPGEDPTARHEPCRVLWVTGAGEDDQYEDLAPRLRAAIASAAAEFGLDPAEASRAIELVRDMSEWPDWSPVTLPGDCARLAAEVGLLNKDGGPPVGLVVADSLTALLSDGFTIDSRQGARRVMGRLARFARASGACLAVLHHMTKDGRVAGSPAVLDGVRLAFTIGLDPDRDGLRTITRHKANGTAGPPQQFAIAGEGPMTHAVFTTAEDARAERSRPAAARAAQGPPADGGGGFRARHESAGGYRCLARDGPGAAGRVVADRVGEDAARAAAAEDAGRALSWRRAPSGMDVAVAGVTSYGVYPSKSP